MVDVVVAATSIALLINFRRWLTAFPPSPRRIDRRFTRVSIVRLATVITLRVCVFRC